MLIIIITDQSAEEGRQFLGDDRELDESCSDLGFLILAQCRCSEALQRSRQVIFIVRVPYRKMRRIKKKNKKSKFLIKFSADSIKKEDATGNRQ